MSLCYASPGSPIVSYSPKGGPKFFSGPPEKKYDKKISSDPILFFDKMIILYDVSCLREKLAQQN